VFWRSWAGLPLEDSRPTCETTTMTEFSVVDLGMGRWHWRIAEEWDGETRTIAESGDHESEAVCIAELNHVIEACRQEPSPTVQIRRSSR
jgi:hypothetical protein